MRISTFLLFYTILCIGCAYVTVENKYIPSKALGHYTQTSLIKPDDISYELDFGSLKLFADLSLYATDYSGLKLLGAEVSRDSDSQELREEFALRFGINNSVASSAVKFSPQNLVFLFHKKNGGSVVIKPLTIYRVENAKYCPFDYGPLGWGKNSQVIDSELEIFFNHTTTNVEYVCFNIVYSLDSTHDGFFELPLDNAFINKSFGSIYFDKVKIKRIRSN
jgi:hypothetical protein